MIRFSVKRVWGFTILSLAILFSAPLHLSAESSLVDLEFVESLDSSGREGTHGMVIFGAGPYYMAHIPMLGMPHDIQIVSEVMLFDSDNIEIQKDLGVSTFTLKPVAGPGQNSGRFSLNKFAKGELPEFFADLHEGSFELGGLVVPGFATIRVQMIQRLVVRKLPGESDLQNTVVGTGENSFEVNVITPTASRQQIKNISTSELLWCVHGPDFFSPCE